MLTLVRNLMGGDTRDDGDDDPVLFIVERDLNRNVVMYRPGNAELVQPSWLLVPEEADLDNITVEMVDEQLVEEDLTKLEQLGYGVKRLSGEGAASRFYMAALPDTPLTLFQTQEGKRRVWVEIEGKRWILQRVMLHTRPRALGWFPTVTEVHLEVEMMTESGAGSGMVAQFYYAV
jgi:hypothetical protein